MSGDIIKEFLVSLGFSINDSQYAKFTGAIQHATIRAVELGAATAAAAGVIIHEISKVADKYNELANISDRVHAPIEQIEEWKYVAELTGSTGDAAVSSMEGLGRAAGSAFLGIGRAKKIFDKLHLSVKDSNGELKSTTQLMAELGDKIKDKGRGEQLFILSRLGIDPSMIRALTTDVGGLKKEWRELMGAAGINADEAATASQRFHNSVIKIKMAFEALWNSIALKVMAALGTNSDALRKKFLDNMPLIIAAVTPVVVTIVQLGVAFGKLLVVFLAVIQPILQLIIWLDKVTSGWSSTVLATALAVQYLFGIIKVATLVGKAWTAMMIFARAAVLAVNISLWGSVTALRAMAVALLANPLTWIILAIVAAVAALVYAILNWDKITKWVFGSVLTTISHWYHSVVDWFDDIEKRLSKIWDKFKSFAISTMPGGALTDVNVNHMLTPTRLGNNTKTVNINQDTKITVSGNSDPHTAAKLVGGATDNSNSTFVRNFQPAAI